MRLDTGIKRTMDKLSRIESYLQIFITTLESNGRISEESKETVTRFLLANKDNLEMGSGDLHKISQLMKVRLTGVWDPWVFCKVFSGYYPIRLVDQLGLHLGTRYEDNKLIVDVLASEGRLDESDLTHLCVGRNYKPRFVERKYGNIRSYVFGEREIEVHENINSSIGVARLFLNGVGEENLVGAHILKSIIVRRRDSP